VPRIAAQRNEKPLNYGDNFALSRKARQRQLLGQGANAGVINRMPVAHLDSGNANGHSYPRRSRIFPIRALILVRPDAIIRSPLDQYLRVDYVRLGLKLMTLPEWDAVSEGKRL
jgi:hypothetical protein